MKPPFVSWFVFSLPKKVETTQKEEGAEKKDKTGDAVNSGCTNAPVAQITAAHWASSGPCSARAPPGHHGLMLRAGVRWPHSGVDLPGKGLPHLRLVPLLPLPGCFTAHSLPSLWALHCARAGDKRGWFSNEPVMLEQGSRGKVLWARTAWGRGSQHAHCLQTPKLGFLLPLAARCGNTESKETKQHWNV